MGNQIPSRPKKPSSNKGSNPKTKRVKGKGRGSSSTQYAMPTVGLAAALDTPPNGSSNIGKKKASGRAKASGGSKGVPGSSKKAPASKKTPSGIRMGNPAHGKKKDKSKK